MNQTKQKVITFVITFVGNYHKGTTLHNQKTPYTSPLITVSVRMDYYDLSKDFAKNG